MTHNHISNQTMTALTDTARLFAGKWESFLEKRRGKGAQRFAVAIEVVVIDYM